MNKLAPIAVAVLFALLVHAVFVFAVSSNVVPTSQGHFDARQYRDLADSVLAGNGFELEDKHGRGPNLTRTPGYPVFLTLFGSGWDKTMRVVVAQHLLVLATAGLVYFWMRRIGQPASLATVAFVIVAFDLTTMTYASYLLTETLFTFLLWSAYLAWPTGSDTATRWGRCATAGLLWGLATLTRPISLYLLPGFVLLTAISGLRDRVVWKRTAIITIVGIVTVSTWYVRNYALSDHFVFSTIEGENLLHYRASLISLPDGANVPEWRSSLRERSNEGRYNPSIPREAAELDAEKKKLAVELVRENPLGLIRLYTVGLPRLFVSPNRTYLYDLIGFDYRSWSLGDVEGNRKNDGRVAVREYPYLIASSGYQFLLLILSAIGCVRVLREREWSFLPVIILLGYLTVFSSGWETHARFRIPLLPGMAVLAAYALPLLAPLWESVRAKRRGS